MSRIARVTVELDKAWEIWDVDIPDDVPEGEEEAWVKENFAESDRFLHDSGADLYSITEVIGGEVTAIFDENWNEPE